MGLPLERMRGAPDYGWDDYRDAPLAFLRKHEPNYTDAVYLAEKWPKKFAVPDYFRSGDPNYGGSLGGQANKEYWEENFGDTLNKTWWDLGDAGILVRLDLATKDQQEALDSLENYPLLDESKHSDLEQKEQTEQWDSWGRSEFKHQIVKLAEQEEEGVRKRGNLASSRVDAGEVEELLDALSDKTFDKITWELWEKTSHYPEGGDEVHYPSAEQIFGDFAKTPNPWGRRIPWDRTVGGLITVFGLEDKIKVDVQLDESAFGPWRGKGQKTRDLRIKKDDLPSAAQHHWRALTTGQIVNMPYDPEVCQSLYLDCEWDLSSLKEET
jgi:hypothetical protein